MSLDATFKQARLTLDVYTAIAQVGPWLEDIAKQRIHGTTKKTALLIKEQLALSISVLAVKISF